MSFAIDLAEKGWVPDSLIRRGIRSLCVSVCTLLGKAFRALKWRSAKPLRNLARPAGHPYPSSQRSALRSATRFF